MLLFAEGYWNPYQHLKCMQLTGTKKTAVKQKEKPWKVQILQENYLYKWRISLQTQFTLLKKTLHCMKNVTVGLL